MSTETNLIEAERSNVAFDVEELTHIYDGSKSQTLLRQKAG